jgi:hypothetical protein
MRRSLTKLVLSGLFLIFARTPDAANAQCSGSSSACEVCQPDCAEATEICENNGGRVCELCSCFFAICQCNAGECCYGT